MRLNGMLTLILVVALAAVTAVAWTEGEEKPVCPMTGETVTCTGDGPHGPHGLAGPHHRPERMAAALGLDNEQREALREIMNADQEAIRERMETALAGILTPVQLDQLDEIKARRESRGDMDRLGPKGRLGGRGPGAGDRGEMGARRLERMKEHLDLTPDQQDQVRQILEEATSPSRSETRELIRSVLTPEQREKMGQQRPQHRSGMGQGAGPGNMHGRKGRGMGRNPHAGGPAGQEMGLPGHLAEQLQLTDEQREALRELMTEIHSEQQSRTRSQIEALLTPEQREKLEQFHK